MSEPLPTGCLSDLTVDRVLAGEVGRGAIASHLQCCERCRTRLTTLEAANVSAEPTVDRIAQAVATRAEAARRARRALASYFAIGAVATAAAAAGIIAFVNRPAERDTPAMRTKGESIRFFTSRDGKVTEGESGGSFRQGDALRFVVTSGAPCELLLVGIESSGKVSVYFPFGGTKSAAIDEGSDVELPGSIVLDDSTGEEYLLALFHASPVKVEAVKKGVASLKKVELGTLQKLDLPGRHHWIVLRKERRAP